MIRARALSIVALAFVALSVPLAASGPEFEVVPPPREGAVEPVAAEQIRLAQAALHEQVQEGGDPTVLAAAFMEMGPDLRGLRALEFGRRGAA